MSLTAAQINTFHMVATCCLANLGSQLAKMEKICDPSYKCLEEKAEYMRMLLSEICGYVPDGEEILPYFQFPTSFDYQNFFNNILQVGDSFQFFVNGIEIPPAYTMIAGGYNVNVPLMIESIFNASGFVISNDFYTLTAPVGSGSEYSNAILTETYNNGSIININWGNMTTGIDAVENNCIDYDDMEKIMRKIATELNICSPFESLPETTLLTNPCGCC